MRVLSDKVDKVTVIQRTLEMENQLAALTAFGRALCEVMLGVGRGTAHLPLCLNESCQHVDSLISEGFHRGALDALMSVGLHYNGVKFEVVGRGQSPGRSKSEVLAIESVATQGVETLVRKMSGASIHRQHQSSRV